MSKGKRTKKRKIAPGWKILICLLLIGSLGLGAGTWLRVRIDTPYVQDATIDEFLALAGVSSETVLTEMIEPELQGLNEELVGMTGVSLDSGATMDLARLLLAGEYKFTDFDTMLEKTGILSGQAERATRTLALLDRDMREVHETLVQVQGMLEIGRIVFSAVLVGLLLLCLIGIITVLAGHRFGLLPYVLVTGLLAGLAQGMRTALNTVTESFGRDLLVLSELSFPFSLDRIDMDVFRVGPAPMLAFLLALAAFLLALITSRKNAPAAEAAQPTGSASVPAPVAAPVAPAADVTPPVQTVARSARPAAPAVTREPAAPVGRQTATTPVPRSVRPTAAPARPAAGATAGGWICPGCGTSRVATERFCPNCGGRRPETGAPGWICPNCGARRAATDRFCTECGARRAEQSAASSTAKPVSAAPAAPAAQTAPLARTQSSSKDTNSSSSFKDLVKTGAIAPEPMPEAAPAPAPAVPSAPATKAPAPQDAEDMLDALLRRQIDQGEDGLSAEDIQI